MRLFNRGADEQRNQAAGLPIGTLLCTERGCLSDQGLACFYTDRRGRSCDTAWCPQHIAAVDGRPYCRRHAGVVRALPSADPAGLPDIDNRAPSLLEWVASEVDSGIAAEVQGAAVAGQKLQSDAAHLVLIAHGSDRIRAWERTWKLYDHTGIHLWVAIDVEEENDLELVIRINGSVVERMVPPWIATRRKGLTLSADADAEQRTAFYGLVVALVREHLASSGTTQG